MFHQEHKKKGKQEEPWPTLRFYQTVWDRFLSQSGSQGTCEHTYQEASDSASAEILVVVRGDWRDEMLAD